MTPLWHRAADPDNGRLTTAVAAVLVHARYLVILAWGAAAVACLAVFNGIPPSEGGVEGFVSEESPAVTAELRSVERFGFPLLSRTMVVQRDPAGLPPQVQAEAVLRATGTTQGEKREGDPVLAAIPVPNTGAIFPGSREDGTTVITYLFTSPFLSFQQQLDAAEGFVERTTGPEDDVVGVTGSIPARAEQARIVEGSLRHVEVATVLAIVLIVGLAFRSVVAPLVTIVTAGIAFLVVSRVAPWVASAFHVTIPGELEPLLVALVLGVVTDYVIFFLSGLRRRIRETDDRLVAATKATADFWPIVVVAGITVAAGTASLLIARSGLIRTFGPGMALAIVVGLVVSVTLVPALMAVLGRWAFWPAPPRPSRETAPAHPRLPRSPVGKRPVGERSIDGRPGLAIRALTWRPSAALVLAATVAGLVLAALPLAHLRLGLAFIPALPPDNQVRQAAAAARAGFAEGILSPTQLVVEGQGLGTKQEALAELGRRVSEVPGVAGVVGPGQLPVPSELGVVLSRDGGAARYLVVFDSEPLSATAIESYERLRKQAPGIAAGVGLGDAALSFSGDTALSQEVVSATTDDLLRISLAALGVNLVLLVLFLRALVAPLYLLAASVLALCASLGLTTYVFQDLLGEDGLTFYVPFAAAVLLVALGSDYNIFGVGHVWEEAYRRPLVEAVRTAMPRSTRAILAAATTLAASFGLLALVPLRPFRELAFAMAVGIVVDALVVRSVLVPTLLTLVGRFSSWPSRQLWQPGTAAAPVTVPVAGE